MPELVAAYPIDRGVYGVHDLGGGLRDWTCSFEDDDSGVENGRIRDQYAGMDLERARTRVARGPCWGDGVHYDLSTRMVDGKEVHSAFVGFRLVRSLDESSGD